MQLNPLKMHLPKHIQARLISPLSQKSLRISGDNSLTVEEETYPIVDGIPILINNNKSLFKTKDFLKIRDTTFKTESKLTIKIKKLIPSVTLNLSAKNNFDFIAKLLKPKSDILVIGGSIQGFGTDKIYNEDFNIIGSDVSHGPQTKIIADCHDLPFKANTFDAVIVQAVLEHVLEPQKCVDEIHRVLKMNGLVYSDTPFMQQVHMAKYDFTRFTHLGHNRLFRNFSELKSGPSSGPGTALAWSINYFFRSFGRTKNQRKILNFLSKFLAFPFKYTDLFFKDRNETYNASSSFYFIGSKKEHKTSDSELLKNFKGF